MKRPHRPVRIRQICFPIVVCAAGLIVLFLGGTFAQKAGIWLNVTTSLPPGIYRELRGAHLLRGSMVVACLPPTAAALGRERGYLVKSERCVGGVAPVGKIVMALPGDSVTVGDDGLAVDGVPVPNSRRLTCDLAGRVLLRMATGRYAVRPGELWIFSPYSSRSWDSRYYGAVLQTGVIALVRPLLTF